MEEERKVQHEEGKFVRFLDDPGKGKWDGEELEELIAKSVIALYEQKWHPLLHPKRMKPPGRPTKNDMEYLRRRGLYFPPSDSAFQAEFVDVKRHGLPEHGSFFTDTGLEHEREQMEEFSMPDIYLKGFSTRMVQKVPQGWRRRGPGPVYRTIYLMAGAEVGIAAFISCHTVNQNTGKVSCCAALDDRHKILDPEVLNDQKKSENMVAICLWNEGEREYLWNVEAMEGIARVCFGVHEEQVKSLFYARDLPMTETGRKRPILHWVASHQRRIREGIEVDVKKHMRGITEFEMIGTRFTITNPAKKEEEREARRALRRMKARATVEIPEREEAAAQDFGLFEKLSMFLKKLWRENLYGK